MAFLDQIGHGQAIVPETGCKGDHQPHVGGGQPMESILVAVVLPADGEGAFLVAFEERGVHRGPDETALNPGDIIHCRCPPLIRNATDRKAHWIRGA